MTRYDKSIQRICMNIPSGSRFPMVTSLYSTLHCSESRFHPIRLHVSSASTAWIFLVAALAAPFPAGLGFDTGDVYEASHCRMGLLILLVRNHFVLCLNCFFHWNVCQLAGGFKHFQTASWIGLWGSINVWRIMIWPNPIKSRTSTKTLHFFHHKPVQSASSGLFHPKTGWPWLANIFKINNQPVSTCGHCW